VYRRLLRNFAPIPLISSNFLGHPQTIADATRLSERKRVGEEEGEHQLKRPKYRHILPKPALTEEKDESPEDEEIFEFDDGPGARGSTSASSTITTSKTSSSSRAGKAKAMPFSFAVVSSYLIYQVVCS
jgi:hypothetical protein